MKNIMTLSSAVFAQRVVKANPPLVKSFDQHTSSCLFIHSVCVCRGGVGGGGRRGGGMVGWRRDWHGGGGMGVVSLESLFFRL